MKGAARERRILGERGRVGAVDVASMKGAARERRIWSRP